MQQCAYICGRLLTPSQLSGVGVEHRPVPLVFVTHAVHQQQLCRCSGFFQCSLSLPSLSLSVSARGYFQSCTAPWCSQGLCRCALLLRVPCRGGQQGAATPPRSQHAMPVRIPQLPVRLQGTCCLCVRYSRSHSVVGTCTESRSLCVIKQAGNKGHACMRACAHGAGAYLWTSASLCML